jgi:DNA-binding Xre family transcriptional regulator
MALRRTPRHGATARHGAGNTDGSGGTDDPGGSGGAAPDLVRAFVDEVTWFMSEHKVSRADLAHSMGVSPGRVSQILSGDENLTLRTLSSVAAALGAEIEVALRAIDGGEG